MAEPRAQGQRTRAAGGGPSRGAGLASLGRIWAPFVARHGQLGLGIACALAAAFALLAMPGLAGAVLDAAAGGDTAAITGLAAGFAAFAMAEAGLRYAARRILIGESRRAELALKRRLERHLVRLPIGWFDTAQSGDVVSRFTQDVETLRFTTGPALLYGLQALVVAPGGVIVMWSMAPSLALVAAIVFGAMGLVLWRLAPAMQRESHAVQEALGAVAQHAAEAFAAIRLVQSAHRVVAEDREMGRRAQRHRDAGIALARRQALADLAIHAAVEIVVLAGLALGAAAVVDGRMTSGDLLQFYALLGIQLTPLLALGFVIGGIPRALGAAARIEAILTEPLEPRGGDSAVANAGTIEWRHLTYRLPGHVRPTLDDVSLRIEPGNTLGVVGAVGSGKSTLLALLLRFRDPPPGTVFVDGVDVLEIDPSALRARFAVALQDPFLFDDSIDANIRFGAADVDVPGAVADAAFDQDLAGFPAGLATIVGERGVTLSGGQRQRVALARALATHRPILVLDDTMSAVDQTTEARILASLARQRAHRTTLITTHRLSAVRDADAIAFLVAGRVVAHGTHDELVRTCPDYAAIHDRQRERDALDGAAP